jgi:hypothetical protein
MTFFGYPTKPAASPPPWNTQYAIREGGTRAEVIRTMEWWWDAKRQTHYEQLPPVDQGFADALADLAQRVCSYFYASDADYIPLEGCPEIEISDDAVRERIQRVMNGEFKREAEDRRQLQYPMDALPWDQQRAYVEQVERLKHAWGFRRLGRVVAAARAA